MHVVTSESIIEFIATEELPPDVIEGGLYTATEGIKERLMKLLSKRQEMIAKVHL